MPYAEHLNEIDLRKCQNSGEVLAVLKKHGIADLSQVGGA